MKCLVMDSKCRQKLGDWTLLNVFNDKNENLQNSGNVGSQRRTKTQIQGKYQRGNIRNDRRNQQGVNESGVIKNWK